MFSDATIFPARHFPKMLTRVGLWKYGIRARSEHYFREHEILTTVICHAKSDKEEMEAQKALEQFLIRYKAWQNRVLDASMAWDKRAKAGLEASHRHSN